MPKRNSGTSSVVVSWWLSEGDEQCTHCGQMYFYEVEFRCVECDGPGCPHCKAVHAEGHFICPECVPSDIAKGIQHG